MYLEQSISTRKTFPRGQEPLTKGSVFILFLSYFETHDY